VRGVGSQLPPAPTEFNPCYYPNLCSEHPGFVFLVFPYFSVFGAVRQIIPFCPQNGDRLRNSMPGWLTDEFVF